MTTENEDINAAFDRDFDKLLAGEWKPATEHYEPMPEWMLRQNHKAYLGRQQILKKASRKKKIRDLFYIFGILLILWAIDYWDLHL